MTLAIMMVTGGCSQQADPPPNPPAPDPTKVRVVRLSEGPITRLVTLPAEVFPVREATLYAKVSGYLREIAVDKGDRVDAGAVIARIEMPELVAALRRQEADVRTSESEFNRLAQAAKRTPDLVVPATLDEARGRLEIAQARLSESTTLLEYSIVTAPFSGVITRRYVDAGALIRSGDANGSSIVTLMDFSKVRLQIGVPEIDATHVEVGQSVRVTTDDLSGQTFEGTVTRFSYVVDPSDRTMLAEAELRNDRLSLRPGMLVAARIALEHHDHAMLLPGSAVVRERSGVVAYVVVEERLRRRPLSIGFDDGQMVEVVAGVAPDDPVAVATETTARLSDGAAVRIVPGS